MNLRTLRRRLRLLMSRRDWAAATGPERYDPADAARWLRWVERLARRKARLTPRPLSAYVRGNPRAVRMCGETGRRVLLGFEPPPSRADKRRAAR